MNIFLDSSVAIAASLSATGASREVFHQAARQGWRLLVSPWVLREVRDNLANKTPDAARAWASLRARTTVEDDELAFDWPIVFEASKDKPVLFSALACADVLLTLDRRDFRDLLGAEAEVPRLSPTRRGRSRASQRFRARQCQVCGYPHSYERCIPDA